MPFGNFHRFNGQLSNELSNSLREALKSFRREQSGMDLLKFYFGGSDYSL